MRAVKASRVMTSEETVVLHKRIESRIDGQGPVMDLDANKDSIPGNTGGWALDRNQ